MGQFDVERFEVEIDEGKTASEVEEKVKEEGEDRVDGRGGEGMSSFEK